MKILNTFLINIGIKKVHTFPEPYNYNINDYNSLDDEDIIKCHKDFLKSTLDEENNRLASIENKTSLIISQTSIVFSLVGLILPVIIEKSSETTILARILIICLVLIAFFFYFLSINNALKNYHITKFRYYVSKPSNVLELKDKSLNEFNSELVRDYLFCINKNIVYNNIKATNLSHAHYTFKIANLITGITILSLCVMIFFFKKEEDIIKIKDPIRIENTNPIFIYQKDTVKIKDTVFIKDLK